MLKAYLVGVVVALFSGVLLGSCAGNPRENQTGFHNHVYPYFSHGLEEIGKPIFEGAYYSYTGNEGVAFQFAQEVCTYLDAHPNDRTFNGTKFVDGVETIRRSEGDLDAQFYKDQIIDGALTVMCPENQS